MHNTSIEIVEKYTPELVKTNKDCLFVFGDNILKKGHGGQAIIRDFSNTFGIPTKNTPSRDYTAYFGDYIQEERAVMKAIEKLVDIKNSGQYRKICFPKHGLGTGLAHMKSKSPYIYKKMKDSLFLYFQYTFDDTE